MHFHGTSVSMFQFPTADVPGIKRQRPALNELSQEKKGVDFCGLKKYLNVAGYKLSVKGAYYPIQRVNVSEQLLTQLKTCFTEEKHIEYQWLTNVATLIGTTVEISSSAISEVNISWTKFHIAKMRSGTDSRNKSFTINILLLVINYNSNDSNLQAQVMNSAKEYTKYLNEDQTVAGGCSDQPLYAWKKKIQWKFPLFSRVLLCNDGWTAHRTTTA